jgi:hypothetical protein
MMYMDKKKSPSFQIGDQRITGTGSKGLIRKRSRV